MSSKEKAIIIGGGISGKLAARVLSDYYNEIIIIERDQKPEGPFQKRCPARRAFTRAPARR
ncbi:hypothetical protein [Neobacillus vireti]|uniref:hypothetical protein n=1 Tax=Neobacillus vireti TaxID=220686 RepID=UPI002FFDFCCA